MINLNHINISYKHVVLDDANISLAPHQIISLVGKSGIGKTSLLNIIGLLSAVNSKTEYYFNSYKIDLQNDEEMSLFRKQHIGYVFQEKNMLNNLTIKENFKLIANLSNEKYSDEKAIQYLKKVQLSININRYPDSLSGGERQRLSIALALYKKPELLLLDEPTSALDQRNKDILMEILKDITQSTDTIVLIVTHDKFIKENSDIVYTIENKKIKLLSGDLAQSNTKLKQSSLISLKLFLREYSYKQFKTNKKLYLMSLSILGIILGCCLFFGTFSKQYLDYMHEEYNQSRLTEIRVSSELFNEKTQSLLEGIDNIVTVYPYANDYVFKIVSNSVELNGNYQIEYYNSRMTGQIGVLIDENLSKKIGLNSKITINNNEYVVSGTIDKNYDTLYHSNNVNTILIPIDNYEGKINSYVVYVKDLNTIEKTVANLKNLFPNSVIQTQDHSIKLTIDSIKILQQVGMTYSVLLLIVVSIMIYMIYYRMILNQKYEILLLKANGLTKKEVRSYQHQLLLIFILITSILAYISFILAYILMKRYYNVNFDIPMFLGLILSILTSVIVNYLLSGISLERLNKISPSEMFRINI